MKLKIKHVSNPAIIQRIELSDNVSLQQAREQCLSVLSVGPGSSAHDVVFSLNRKSPLTGSDNDTLKGLGICSGDTLWILSPELINTATAAATAQPPPPAAAAVAAMEHPIGAPANRATAVPEDAHLTAARAAAAAAIARAQAQQQLYQSAAGDAQHTSKSVAVPDHSNIAIAAAAAAAGSVELDPPPPPKPGVPDHLQRLLSLAQQQQQQRELSSVQLLLLAVHAAMQESGLRYQQQPQQQPAAAAAGLLPNLSGVGGVYSLTYTLPGAKPVADDSSPGSSSSSLEILLKVIDVGNHLVIAASTKKTEATADGSNSGSSGSSSSLKLVTTLKLPKSNIKLVSTTTTSAAAAAADKDSNPDSSDAPASSSAAAAAVADQETMHLIGRYSDVFKLWVLLKDRLCLPLLVAAAAAAGLPAPVGLNSLPFELQEAVLQLLQAKDLTSLCCACTVMRHRASTDTLWKTLFDKTFPLHSTTTSSSSSSGGSSSRLSHPSDLRPRSSSEVVFEPWKSALAAACQRIRQDACRNGWKWAYGAACKARLRVLDDQRRGVGGSWPHMHPYPNPGMPWGPFRPQNPIMPPNVIGGDYDRFPNLGGFAGGLGGSGLSGGAMDLQDFGGGMRGGVAFGSGGALFSGVQGRGGVLPGRGGGGVGLGFPGLGVGRRREGGGGLGRLY